MINVSRLGKLGYNRDGYNVESIDVARSSGDPRWTARPWPSYARPPPFSAFTPEMQQRQDILEVISTFKFTRAGSTSACNPVDDHRPDFPAEPARAARPYVVVGNPVSHSRSPAIRAAFARQTGEAVQYDRLEALPAHYVADYCARRGGHGFNVTTPFKLEAY